MSIDIDKKIIIIYDYYVRLLLNFFSKDSKMSRTTGVLSSFLCGLSVGVTVYSALDYHVLAPYLIVAGTLTAGWFLYKVMITHNFRRLISIFICGFTIGLSFTAAFFHTDVASYLVIFGLLVAILFAKKVSDTYEILKKLASPVQILPAISPQGQIIPSSSRSPAVIMENPILALSQVCPERASDLIELKILGTTNEAFSEVYAQVATAFAAQGLGVKVTTTHKKGFLRESIISMIEPIEKKE